MTLLCERRLTSKETLKWHIKAVHGKKLKSTIETWDITLFIIHFFTKKSN